MTRDYVRALVRHRDREFVISDLWQVAGFRQQAIVVRKMSLSPSTYSFQKRVELAVKHVTTTSTKLLYFVLYLGILDLRPFDQRNPVLPRQIFYLGHRRRRFHITDYLDLVSGRAHYAHSRDTWNLPRKYHGGDQAAPVHDRPSGSSGGHSAVAASNIIRVQEHVSRLDTGTQR